MKYIMMMHCPKTGYESFGSMPKEDIRRHHEFMHSFNKKLQQAGEWVSAEGLATPQSAKRVRAREDGTPDTDGVFPESKEFLAGYWIVEVKSPERAYELAAQASAAPGVGGKPMNMWLEVREVLCAPPEQAG